MVKENMSRMKAAYASQDGNDNDDDDDEKEVKGKGKVENKSSNSNNGKEKKENGAFAEIFSPPAKKTKTPK